VNPALLSGLPGGIQVFHPRFLPQQKSERQF